MKIFNNDLESKMQIVTATMGLESRLDILKEECAELIQASSKLCRAKGFSNVKTKTIEKDAVENLYEEMADVYICLYELILAMEECDTDVQKQISYWIDKKVNRTYNELVRYDDRVIGEMMMRDIDYSIGCVDEFEDDLK